MQTLEQLGYEKQNEFGRDCEFYQKSQGTMTIQIAIDYVDKTVEKSHFFSGDYDATESSYSEALSTEELQASLSLLENCKYTTIDEAINGTDFILNGFHFVQVGVEGIYVLNRVAFVGEFNQDANNDWEKSSGKKTLQTWAKYNLPKEILERFDVDLPTVEEVFSQKMLNVCKSSMKLKSKQFPIFQNSDNRMMEFDGKPMWWWTKTAFAGYACFVLGVCSDGGLGHNAIGHAFGFVPVLRRKPIHDDKAEEKE